MDTSLLLAAGPTAFGDASHPSTRGALAMLAALDMTVLKPHIACDIGSGSGILALAIAQQCHCPVIAVDLHPHAVATIHTNAQQNQIALGVLPDQASVLPVHADGFNHEVIVAHAPYALIVANILVEPLIALAAPMYAHLASGGALILSGLLRWQESHVRDAYTSLGLECVQRVTIGDWITLGFGKP